MGQEIIQLIEHATASGGLTSAAGLIVFRKLLAGMADVPLAYLQGFAQDIRDGATQRSKIRAALADAVIASAAHDPVIVEAAAETYLPAELRRKINRAKVAVETAILLEDQTERPPHGEPPSDDFLNKFERLSEDISSDEMRSLFARILAGEIRHPGSFSLPALRIASELDQAAAKLFEEAVHFFVDWTYPSDIHSDKLNDLIVLADAGLIQSSTARVFYEISVDDKMVAKISDGEYGLLMRVNNLERSLSVPVYVITKAGLELAAIIHRQDPTVGLRRLAQIIKNNTSRIDLFETRLQAGEVIIETLFEAIP